MDSFATGRGIRAADLNRLASDAAAKGIAGSAYLAHSNGFELVQRNPRRVRRTSKLVAIGAVPVDGGVLGAIDAAKRGPRTAVVYNPATREIGEAVVCPAEIAGQFPATDAHMETYVVAIQCVVSEAGSGAEGR